MRLVPAQRLFTVGKVELVHQTEFLYLDIFRVLVERVQITHRSVDWSGGPGDIRIEHSERQAGELGLKQ